MFTCLEIYGDQTENVQKEMEFLTKYMTLKFDIREKIGHSFTDFIEDCTYRGTSCKDVQ